MNLSFKILPFFLLAIFSSYAQEWKKSLPPNPEFSDIKKAVYEQLETNGSVPASDVNKRADGEFQQFQRWEHFMKFRAKGKGKIDPGILWQEWEKFNSVKKSYPAAKATAGWTFIGPSEIPGMGGGMGRINTVEFHPSNPAIFWVGSASGGLWKTTDGGNTWSTTTDFLAAIGISDIAVDPQNPDNIYIATGDGYGYESGVDFWGGTYSAGILKSADGGMTWNPAGLTYTQNQGIIIQRLVINPSDPQVLLAATRTGVWRTADGGTTWTKVRTGHYYDIEFNTANDSIVYAANGYNIYKSADMGQNWSLITSALCSGGRQSIAVTPSNPNVIYSMCESGNFYKSSDGGVTFTQQNNSSVTFYGYYDNVLAVSPLNENKVLVGGLELGMSADGGQTWSIIDNWYGWPNASYCHADKKDIAFHPDNGNDIFICNDGGIFKTTDNGNSYTDLSSGIAISQFYRLGGAAADENIVYCGQQDNGVVKKDYGNWDMKVFADGMECIVDYSNPGNVLVMTQNGQLNLSNDGGQNWADVTPSSGSWITPIAYHPTDPSVVFAAYEQLYKSTDGGWNWVPAGNPTNNTAMDVLTIAPSDPDYIYAGTIDNLFRTTDGGLNWQKISSPLPLSNNAITYVAVSSDNPLEIWATLSGYSPGMKVYHSADGGDSWTNISGTLPNIPVNCIVYQNNSPGIVYIGTDFGVFYRDSTMADWAPFDENLPKVIVNELEIQYNVKKLRAATYGRGLWESYLADAAVSERGPEKGNDFYLNIFPNPSSGKIYVSPGNKKTSPAKISVYSPAGLLLKTVESSGNNIVPLDLSGFSPGMYFIAIRSGDELFVKKISLIK